MPNRETSARFTKPLPRVVMIAAVSRNGVLAVDGRIPWHLPRDTAHFRARTDGRWLLLGRRTFEQMTGWFRPDHTPVVLTGNGELPVSAGHVAASIPEAMALARQSGAPELIVCGGGQVYEAALPWASEVILTTVETIVREKGEITRFPDLWEEEWRMVSEEEFPADAENPLRMRFRTFVRRGEGSGIS